jgi:integrase
VSILPPASHSHPRSRSACWLCRENPLNGHGWPASDGAAERSPKKGDKQGGAPSIYPALVLALNGGMRDSEIKRLTWSQIDWNKKMLTAGRSQTDAGSGRTIPLNGTLLVALLEHTRWYAKHFGAARPDWFVFPGGSRFPKDPAR